MSLELTFVTRSPLFWPSNFTVNEDGGNLRSMKPLSLIGYATGVKSWSLLSARYVTTLYYSEYALGRCKLGCKSSHFCHFELAFTLHFLNIVIV